MKPKAKTLIERLGFADPDRGSPEHDRIQLWVYENIHEVLKRFASDPGKTFNIYRKQLELPIIQQSPNFKTVVGFIDLFVTGRVYDPQGEALNVFEACIEVKTRIVSCGELLRQIAFYKQYQRATFTWIVVSPDDRFEGVLREHGVYFYHFDR